MEKKQKAQVKGREALKKLDQSKLLRQLFPIYTKEIAIFIVLIFLVFVMGMIETRQPSSLEALERPAYKDGSKAITVFYDYGDHEDGSYQFDLAPESLSGEETKTFIEDLNPSIADFIKNQYQEYKVIDGPIELKKSFRDASISYEFEPKGYINQDGWFNREAFDVPKNIVCTYEISMDDRKDVTYTTNGRLMLSIEPEAFTDAYDHTYSQYLLDLFHQKINEDVDEKMVELPGEFTFYHSKKINIPVILLGGGAGIIALLSLMSNLEEKSRRWLEEKKRRVQLMYVINNFLLLCNSGMTLRKSFILAVDNRIVALQEGAGLYEDLKKLSALGTRGRALKDILHAFESIFYMSEGHRFVSLLLQNEKYGDDKLVDQLQYLSRSMWDKRIRKARKTSEKAGTKLVFPMLLIFIVIIIITIVPTFMEVETML